MRICIDLGLHRWTASIDKLTFDNQMRKRLFWACYCLDRAASISHGRPFAISDCDIDVPVSKPPAISSTYVNDTSKLPWDIDEESEDLQSLEAAAGIDPTQTPSTSTSLSSFIHITRLRRIESSIQQKIYCVDRPASYTDDDIESFLTGLQAWRDRIPLDVFGKADDEKKPYDGPEIYVSIFRNPLEAALM